MGGTEVLLLLALGAGLWFWGLGKAATNLVYYPGNITGFSLEGFSPVIFAELRIQNTNNISFTINSLAGNVFSNGSLIGNISNFTPVAVPGNSQSTIPLTLVLQPLTLVNDIISIISGGAGSRTLKIEGSVNANGYQEPFVIDYQIGQYASAVQ